MFSPQGPVSFTAQGRQQKLNKQHFNISFLSADFTVRLLIRCPPFCFRGPCAPSHVPLPCWCSSPELLHRCNTKTCCPFLSVPPRYPATFVSAPLHPLQLLSKGCCCLCRVPPLSSHPHNLASEGWLPVQPLPLLSPATLGKGPKSQHCIQGLQGLDCETPWRGFSC